MLQFVTLLVLITASTGHIFRLGDCPEVEVMENFKMDKFLGKWFVLQKFRTMSNCMVEEVTKDDQGDYYISEYLAPLGFEIHQKGRIEFSPNNSKSIMKIDYPITSPLGQQNYWIIDTDYKSFAAVWSCQKLLFGHRQSAQIMSRTSDLPLEKIRQLRQTFESFGINQHDLSFIDQKNCSLNNQSSKRLDETDCDRPPIKTSNLAIKLGPVHLITKRRRRQVNNNLQNN